MSENIVAALTLAADRLNRCAVDHAPNSREFFERAEWADEARAAAQSIFHGHKSDDPSAVFAAWISEGPKLAKAAGVYVGITVSDGPLSHAGSSK